MPDKCQPLKKGTYSISSGFRPPDRPDHQGLDFAASLGTPIYSATGGIVIEGKERAAGSVSGFGNWVWIDSQTEFGLDLIYGHMRHSDILVRKGDRVKPGQMIARVGSEGGSTGPHLHFETWSPPGRLGGQPKNPTTFLSGAREPDTAPIVATTPRTEGIHKVGDPVWLADVLRAEGLRCDIMDGAFERGHGDFGSIWGVVMHHTGDEPPYDAGPRSIAFHPSLGLCSQLHLGRNGVYTLCGVGIAWHAGNGSWPGLPTNDANRLTIGIEAENNGTEGWKPVQYDAYVTGVGAILRKLGHGSSRAIGHKEWARVQGKWDPGGMDMNRARSDIQSVIERRWKVDDDMDAKQAQQLAEVHEQIRKGWTQLGKNEQGQPLTLVDGVAKSLRQQEEILALLKKQ